LCAVEEPSDDVELAIAKQKDYANAWKERRRENDVGVVGSEIADLTRLLMLGQLKQLTATQQLWPAASQPLPAIVMSSWVPITCDHWRDIFEHTLNFYNQVERRKTGLPNKFLRQLFKHVVVDNRININMLLDNSDNSSMAERV
jgi:hypothetical protein